MLNTFDVSALAQSYRDLFVAFLHWMGSNHLILFPVVRSRARGINLQVTLLAVLKMVGRWDIARALLASLRWSALVRPIIWNIAALFQRAFALIAVFQLLNFLDLLNFIRSLLEACVLVVGRYAFVFVVSDWFNLCWFHLLVSGVSLACLQYLLFFGWLLFLGRFHGK